MKKHLGLWLMLAQCCLLPTSFAGDAILLQSTTSTANSGLYDYLLPMFKGDSGIEVRVVAVGTGQAINNAKQCDGDVLLVHAKSAEQAFVADGYGVKRYDVMHNDFIIVGPNDSNEQIANADNVLEVLMAILDDKRPFVSRGDNSGTHKKEMALWDELVYNPIPQSGRWYLETGAGMGATLNVAIGLEAYTLTDRATWISFNNKQNHRIVFEDDEKLFNQYGIILVNPARCDNVDAQAGQTFIDWMLSARGQAAIAAYRIDDKPLFFPNASSP